MFGVGFFVFDSKKGWAWVEKFFRDRFGVENCLRMGFGGKIV